MRFVFRFFFLFHTCALNGFPDGSGVHDVLEVAYIGAVGDDGVVDEVILKLVSIFNIHSSIIYNSQDMGAI